jgi:hypothetical protein
MPQRSSIPTSLPTPLLLHSTLIHRDGNPLIVQAEEPQQIPVSEVICSERRAVAMQ